MDDTSPKTTLSDRPIISIACVRCQRILAVYADDQPRRGWKRAIRGWLCPRHAKAKP